MANNDENVELSEDYLEQLLVDEEEFNRRHQLESDEEEKQGEEVDQQDKNEHQVQYEATFVFPTGWPIQEDVGKIQKEHQHFALEKLKAVEERMQQVKNAETKFVEDGV